MVKSDLFAEFFGRRRGEVNSASLRLRWHRTTTDGLRVWSGAVRRMSFDNIPERELFSGKYLVMRGYVIDWHDWKIEVSEALADYQSRLDAALAERDDHDAHIRRKEMEQEAANKALDQRISSIVDAIAIQEKSRP